MVNRTVPKMSWSALYDNESTRKRRTFHFLPDRKERFEVCDEISNHFARIQVLVQFYYSFYYEHHHLQKESFRLQYQWRIWGEGAQIL